VKLPPRLLTQQDDNAVHAWMEHGVIDKSRYIEQLSQINRSPLAEACDVLALRSGHILERVTLPQYARGRPIGRVFSFRDITQRLANKARLELAAKVFETSLDAIFITDAERRIVAANPSFERLTGYRGEQALGRLPEDFLDNAHQQTSYQRLQTTMAEKGFWEGELWNRRDNGEVYLCLISLVMVKDQAGKASNYIGFFKDLTEALAARKRIEELAYHDALTGLPNRLMFSEHFEFAKKIADRKATTTAVLFIDLDRFKHINDALGHLFGDRVLVEVAERLKSCLREVDTVSRLGGDEFLILLNDVNAAGAEASARRISQHLSAPLSLSNLAFTITCSIGIALYPQDGDSMDELIKNADSAMYAVKERGRSGFRFYTRQMNIGLLSRVKLDHAMRQALENHAFKLQYQPQIDLATGQMIGTEALLRWHDAELGNIPPGRFIPIAEESGAIVPLGDWVLRQATRQAADWHAKGLRLVTSVNVSALQFQQADFVRKVAEALEASALPAHLLELELTESILIQHIDETLKRLQALAQLGVRLAIDDFGTGYSNLAYLKRFPINKLKIDQSFVRDVPGEDSDTAIVHAIINLGHSLHLRVIAEGVETEAQREFLRQGGCDEMQGFLSAPALDENMIDTFARQHSQPSISHTPYAI
jgi:diguanylate cyclase (GGDEF)-like protein/PAS domain S-box-containing protein